MTEPSNKETNEEIYQLFCSRVKSRRLAKGITQEDLAEALGMSRPNYNLIESGKTQILLHHAYRICKILKMKVFE